DLRAGIRGKSVLVIGGAGTIGSSFIRALLRFEPSRLYVVDLNENGLTELTRDLRSTLGQFVPEDYIDIIVECAKKARINGLLALEEDTNTITDSFLKGSLQMIVDSIDPEKVKLQMEAQLDSVEERHTQERALYDKGAQLGPAFGMIGTLIGLINMLKNLTDIETVGPNMAVALVTTFYGSCLANIVFAPISSKLRVRHDEEFLCMLMVCEGVQAIQSGENPKLIEDKLLHLLPEYRQNKGKKGKKGGGDDGGDSKKAAKAKKK
ncbi:MAG: MotA/TolQ/ExbB proton channel family protein, partial [Oscillospiraceae bacterium]